jgi:hypothetical protein
LALTLAGGRDRLAAGDADDNEIESPWMELN